MIAETKSAIDEMKTTLNRNFGVLMGKTRAGEPLDLDERLLFRFQSGQILERCSALISRMFYSCGALGIYRTGPICRTFADIHSGRTHIANNPAATGRNMGAVMLGLPNTDTFI